jgi:hypothetical protein
MPTGCARYDSRFVGLWPMPRAPATGIAKIAPIRRDAGNDEESPMTDEKLSRRQLLQGTIVGMAAVPAASLFAGSASAESLPECDATAKDQKVYAKCEVTIVKGVLTCTPARVDVKQGRENGIQWTFKDRGPKFVRLLIDGALPTGDFGLPQFLSDSDGRSIMAVSDSVTTLRGFEYTLVCRDANDQPICTPPDDKTKPQIKNQ